MLSPSSGRVADLPSRGLALMSADKTAVKTFCQIGSPLARSGNYADDSSNVIVFI